MSKRSRVWETRYNAAAGERSVADDSTKKLKNTVITRSLDLAARELEIEQENVKKVLKNMGKKPENDVVLEDLKKQAQEKRKNGVLKRLLENYIEFEEMPDENHELYLEFMAAIGDMPPPRRNILETPQH